MLLAECQKIVWDWSHCGALMILFYKSLWNQILVSSPQTLNCPPSRQFPKLLAHLADCTPYLVLSLLHFSNLILHCLQCFPNAFLQFIELLLAPGLSHHNLPSDFSLEVSTSCNHNLVHVQTVGNIHLCHLLIHRPDPAASCKILKLHLGQLILLGVL